MAQDLSGKTIAIVVADGFEQVELTEPKRALEQAGARTHIISPAQGQVRAWKFTDWGDRFPVDVPLAQADPNAYDALLLPGGVMNPDVLRPNQDALRLIQAFFAAKKPVAAICHGPWTLIDADVVKGRTLTSYPSLQTDSKNAGAQWVDQAVVVDKGLVTSRTPDDIPAFTQQVIAAFSTGPSQQQRAA